MVKLHIVNSLNQQFLLKIIQRDGRQFRGNSKCSEKKYNDFLSMHFPPGGAYFIRDCPISKDAVEYALSFCGFSLRKRTRCSEEKCKILIGENQLRFTVNSCYWLKHSQRVLR